MGSGGGRMIQEIKGQGKGGRVTRFRAGRVCRASALGGGRRCCTRFEKRQGSGGATARTVQRGRWGKRDQAKEFVREGEVGGRTPTLTSDVCTRCVGKRWRALARYSVPLTTALIELIYSQRLALDELVWRWTSSSVADSWTLC